MSLDKRLTELFALFENKDKNEVEVSEIPTIIRALGLVPSESEMRKTVTAMVGEESAHSVHLAAFLTVAKKLIMDRRFPASSKLELQTALSVLSKEGKKLLEDDDDDGGGAPSYNKGTTKKFYPPGTLTREDLCRLLTKEGETLTQEESEELLVTLPLQEGDAINQEVYLSQLAPTSSLI